MSNSIDVVLQFVQINSHLKNRYLFSEQLMVMLLNSAAETINVILADRPQISFGCQINLDFLLKNLLLITFLNFPAIQVNYFPVKGLIHLVLL